MQLQIYMQYGNRRLVIIFFFLQNYVIIILYGDNMKTTIKDLDLNNKKVIIRVDFNVPIKEGKIVDNTRIVNSLETIKYCLYKASKVILLSHLGRI